MCSKKYMVLESDFCDEKNNVKFCREIVNAIQNSPLNSLSAALIGGFSIKIAKQ